METPILSETPSKGMLYYHGAMLPVLSLGGMAALLFFDLTWRAVPWLVAPAVVVGMILWSTIYLSTYAQQASRLRFIQIAALAVAPVFLLSEKIFFSWGMIKHAIMAERIDFISIAAPALSLVMVGFIGWAAWTFWKTKTEEGFKAFLFVWFWTSPFSSIALVVGLFFVGLPPVGTIGDGSPCTRHPIRCAVVPWLILVWILIVAWWAWRLVRRAGNASVRKE